VCHDVNIAALTVRGGWSILVVRDSAENMC
jgi:hypothetical protein